MLKNTLAVVGLLSLMLVVGGASWEAFSPTTQIPQQKPGGISGKNPGGVPYTPSRIEWLAVELNSVASRRFSAEGDHELQFVPRWNGIQVYVSHLPTMDKESLKAVVSEAKTAAYLAAKRHGWDSWLKVREHVVKVIARTGR